MVIQAGAFAQGGEVFILDMGKPVRIADLARDLIRLSGLEPDKDIEIRYTGVRPGEKLYEEILTGEEGITATRHDRIFIGKPGDFAWEELQFMIRKMEQVVSRRNSPGPGEIKELLQQVVPAYRMEAVYRRAGAEASGLTRRDPAQMELEFAGIEIATST